MCAMKIMESQNGLGWKGPPSPPTPTPAMGRAAPQQLRLPRAPSNLALSASRDGASQLLWAAVPAPHCPLSKEFSPNTYPKFPLFYFKAIFSLVLSLSVKSQTPSCS